MQLSNNHSLSSISALAETSINTLHNKIHRYVSIIIPKFIESASESKWSFKEQENNKNVYDIGEYILCSETGE